MKTRLIVLGGFLGAGKTTLMLAAAKRLAEQGLRVGLVTNDQGSDLVDTAVAAAQKLPVTEVAGGCFCCQFPDLLESLFQLQKQVQPHVILAEPVGSCTDLMATVLLPLQRFYHDVFELAPLSVLVDAGRDTNLFSSTVNYLYEKQLAEAEYLLLNKVDLLEDQALIRALDEMQARHPGAWVTGVSAKHGQGMADWLEKTLHAQSRLAQVLDIDYGRYGAAEAELGWLNFRVAVNAGGPFAADKWLGDVLKSMQVTLQAHNASIAHIKAHLIASTVELKASITATDGPAYWDLWSPQSAVDQAHLLLNARVACDPALLDATVRQTLAAERPRPDYQVDFLHSESFRPAPPQPTHRLAPAA